MTESDESVVDSLMARTMAKLHRRKLVDVVRCGECVNGKAHERGDHSTGVGCALRIWEMHDPDWFCSDGKRKP